MLIVQIRIRFVPCELCGVVCVHHEEWRITEASFRIGREGMWPSQNASRMRGSSGDRLLCLSVSLCLCLSVLSP